MPVRLTRRGLIAFGAGIGAAALAAACQSPPPAEVTKVVERPVEVTKVVERPVEVTRVVSVVATPQPAQIKMVYWDWFSRTDTPQDKAWWDWVEQTFEKQYPNIVFDFQNVPFDDYMTKFLTAYAGGAPPDAMASSVNWAATLWDKAAIRDLGDYIRASKLIRMDNYAQSSVDFVSSKGHIFGVPASGPDSYILIGNKEILASKGIDLKSLTTYDKLREAALTLTERDTAGTVTRAGYLLSPLNGLDKIYVWLLTNGSTMYDQAQTMAVFDQPEYKAKSAGAFQFILDLQYKDKVSLPFTAGRDTTALFSQKKAAIVEGGNWNIPRYKELFPDLQMDIIMYPSGPTGNGPTTHTWTNMQVLPSNTKNSDAGWKFIEFHSSTPSLIKRMETMGDIGPPLDLYQSPAFADLVKRIPAYGEYPPIIKAGKYLDYRKYDQVEKAILPVFQAMMLQKASVEETLSKAAAVAKQALAE